MKYVIPVLLIIFGGISFEGFTQTIKAIEEQHLEESTKLIPMDMPKRKAPTATVRVDSLMQQTFGKDLSQHLVQTETYLAHKVEPFVAERTDSNCIEGFQILQTTTLSKDQYLAIGNLLGNSGNYLQSDLLKQCYFLPDMGLQLFDGNDTVTVLLSLQCDMVRFYHQDGDTKTFRTFNSDPGHQSLADFYHAIFPERAGLTKQQMLESMKMQLVGEPLYYIVSSGDGWYRIQDRASRKFNREIDLTDICTWNKIDEKAAKTNQIKPHPGQRIIVGFE